MFHEINEHLIVLRIIHERTPYLTALMAAHQLGRSVEDVLTEAGKLQITSNSLPFREWKTPEPPPAKA